MGANPYLSLRTEAVALVARRLILQPFLSRHLLDCRYLVRLREVRIAL